MTREGVVVPTGGYGRRNTRVLTVATVGRGFPNTPVLARQHPGLVVINTRVLATSTPGCCDAKRGVLERHRYIIDFQGVFFWRTTDNGQQTTIYPYGFIPNVETCRGASLPRGGFHAVGCTRQIYIPYIYIIYTPRQPRPDVQTCRGASLPRGAQPCGASHGNIKNRKEPRGVPFLHFCMCDF